MKKNLNLILAVLLLCCVGCASSSITVVDKKPPTMPYSKVLVPDDRRRGGTGKTDTGPYQKRTAGKVCGSLNFDNQPFKLMAFFWWGLYKLSSSPC
jgi:hypothetical protein